MKPLIYAQIQEVKSRLREAHSNDMRNALLVGRASEPLFHDALRAIIELEKSLEDISSIDSSRDQ